MFFDRRRAGALCVCFILCTGLFFLSISDRVGPGELKRAREANKYITSLVDRWRGEPLDRVAELAEAEDGTLEDFYYWYSGFGYGEPAYASEEEAYAAIAHIPALVKAARSGDESFYSLYYALTSALGGLIDEIDYLAGYGDYLTNIQSQAQIQSQTSLFGKPGSFSRRNLKKTADDFATILGVDVELGSSAAITKWLDFEDELGDYLHLLAIVIIVMAFLEERRRGLWSVIRSLRGGRARLGLTRLGVLFFGSVLAMVLFTLSPLLLSLAIHGGWADLSRPLQSVPAFGTCPLSITFAQWLLQFLALKVLAGVLMGLLVWCLLGSLTNVQFSVSVLGAALAAEFALYELLPVQSFLNVLKYFNIFAYVHTAALYTKYLNVNLFGFPAGIRGMAITGIAVFGTVLAVLAVLTQALRRPEGSRDILGRAAAPVEKLLDRLRSRLSLGGWEGWKHLVFQYGILLLAVAVFATGKLTFIQAASDREDPMYAAYMDELQGPIDGSTYEYIAHARESARESEDPSSLLHALDAVEDRLEELCTRAEAGGYRPWVVNSRPYDWVYGGDSRERQRLNSAVAIILVSLLAASLWSYERESGVPALLRATPRGRGALLRRKALAAALLAGSIWAVMGFFELKNGFLLFRPQGLSAPARNIDDLARFPLPVNCWQYLAILYALRLMMLIGVAEAAMCVGYLCPTVRTSYVACAAALGLPALLTALGVDLFKWVSPVIPVSSAELMWSLGGGSMIALIPWLLWLAASTVIALTMRKKWV